LRNPKEQEEKGTLLNQFAESMLGEEGREIHLEIISFMNISMRREQVIHNHEMDLPPMR